MSASWVTMKTYRTAKLSRGLYNYRGYCIAAYKPNQWVIFNEDDTISVETKTLKKMKQVCDSIEKSK